MTAVFVHGVPETEQVFDKLRNQLSGDDHVALSLPGFGCPLPEGFEPTMDGYAEWLIAELEQLASPPHLVGHDWGGLLTIRAVSLRPELVESWVTDVVGTMDPGFEWHAVAKVWQTPGDGEALMDAQLGLDVAGRAELLTPLGVPADDADKMAAALDRTMSDAILSLYRSAVRVNEEWGPAFEAIPRPGLALVPTEDPFSGSSSNARCAAACRGERRRARRSGPLVDADRPGRRCRAARGVLGERRLTAKWAPRRDGRAEGLR